MHANHFITHAETALQFEDVSSVWSDVFTSSLWKVLEQVHPTLSARFDALQYVESLLSHLLSMLCAKPTPYSVPEIEERIRTMFPMPIDKWALDDAREEMEKFKKKAGTLVLPLDRIHQILQKDILMNRLEINVAVYIVAVLEYISADLFKLAGNYVKNIHRVEITCQDIRVAMCADKVLNDIFMYNGFDAINETETSTETCSYKRMVKDFILDEEHYLRNLNMIIKVFFDSIKNILGYEPTEPLRDMIQNLNDLIDFSFTALTSFEDILEMSDDQIPPLVGACLEELAEDQEFEVYARYTDEIFRNRSPDRLINILQERNGLNVLPYAGQGFREAVKYYLPKLLRYPIWHALAYFDYIKLLQDISPSDIDRDNLKQVEGILRPLEVAMNKMVSSLPRIEREYDKRLHSQTRKQLVMEKINEMIRIVDGFEAKYEKKYCGELIREDTLTMYSGAKKGVERCVVLFDGMLVICKAKKSSSVAGQLSSLSASYDYKLKAALDIVKIEIKDRQDTDEISNAFEIFPRKQPSIILCTKTYEDKCNWMSDLIMLNTRCMLERILYSLQVKEEQNNPIKLPSVELYRFSEPDSPDNIIFEDKDSSVGGSMIKGATLLKLIERLTSLVYSDESFKRIFLVQHRTFSSSSEILELLKERFNIPDAAVTFGLQSLTNLNSKEKEDIKRYRKKLSQPIQFKVLNVINHWVDHYYNIFEDDPELLRQLRTFLESITEKSMKKWAICVLNTLRRKIDRDDSSKEIIHARNKLAPPIEWHILCPEKDWTLLTLHPIEVARQLTLIDYDLYHSVNCLELVGKAWNKEPKDKYAPTITKISRHTTNLSLWIEKSIVETENIEERVAIVSRLLEIMQVLSDLNNFNGLIAIYSALDSACVSRLKFTFQQCSARLLKVLQEARDLCGNHFKLYLDRLKVIDSPCVPFLGIFLTNILHIEEGNPDFILNTDLINFNKRRRITEVILDVLKFQDKPYILNVNRSIRYCLENLNPFVDISEADNYLYHKSLEIEPKDAKIPPRFPRRWPDINLKSPGVKQRGALSSRISVPANLLLDGEGSSIFPFSLGTANKNSTSPNDCRTPTTPNDKAHIAFTPIFFGPDLPAGMDYTQMPSYMDSAAPPLPPRLRKVSTSSILQPVPLPTKDFAPPPLPPRRESIYNGNHLAAFDPLYSPSTSSTPCTLSPAETTLLSPSTGTKFDFSISELKLDEMNGQSSNSMCATLVPISPTVPDPRPLKNGKSFFAKDLNSKPTSFIVRCVSQGLFQFNKLKGKGNASIYK